MEPVLIQIINDKAYKLLEDLEDLQVLKVIKYSKKPVQKLSEKYMGVFSKDDATSFDQNTKSSRGWEQ